MSAPEIRVYSAPGCQLIAALPTAEDTTHLEADAVAEMTEDGAA